MPYFQRLIVFWFDHSIKFSMLMNVNVGQIQWGVIFRGKFSRGQFS